MMRVGAVTLNGKWSDQEVIQNNLPIRKTGVSHWQIDSLDIYYVIIDYNILTNIVLSGHLIYVFSFLKINKEKLRSGGLSVCGLTGCVLISNTYVNIKHQTFVFTIPLRLRGLSLCIYNERVISSNPASAVRPIFPQVSIITAMKPIHPVSKSINL